MANYCNTKDCIDKFNLHKKNEISSPYTRELEFKELTNSQEKVVLETKNLQDFIILKNLRQILHLIPYFMAYQSDFTPKAQKSQYKSTEKSI